MLILRAHAASASAKDQHLRREKIEEEKGGGAPKVMQKLQSKEIIKKSKFGKLHSILAFYS